MSPPLACVEVDEEYMVCKLQISICGLKRASRQRIKFEEVVTTNGFKEGIVDPCIYMKVSGSNTYSWFYMLLFYLQLMIPTCQLRQNSYNLPI